MPASDSGDDLVWVCGPDKGFGLGVVFLQEAVDGDLEFVDRAEHAAFQSPFGKCGEEALDGVEP